MSQCVASLTTAKLPLPIVLSRKYFPIFICRLDWHEENKPERGLVVEVIVDRREVAIDDSGDADTDDVGELRMDSSEGMGRGAVDNGDSLNI